MTDIAKVVARAARSELTRICLLGFLLSGFSGQLQAQVSSLCFFTNGPRAGTIFEYPPITALPIGTPCQDGILSNGVIISRALSSAYIKASDLPGDPGGQDTPITCWAASLSYVFAYFGHDVDQDAIWRRYYTNPHTGDPMSMSAALNTTWTDADGATFRITSKITDKFWGTSGQITNQDVVQALTDNVPVFFGTSNHAMVLIKVRYYNTPAGPFIVDGEAWDPNPTYHGGDANGIREIAGKDIQAMFAAIPDVH